MSPESRKIQKSHDFMGQVVLFPPTCNGRPPGPSKVVFWKGAVDISPVFLGIQKGVPGGPPDAFSQVLSKKPIANLCAWSLKTCLVSRHETYRNIKKRNLIFGCKLQLMEFRSIPSRAVLARLIFAPSPKFRRILRCFYQPLLVFTRVEKKTMKFASISH
jgi:hypothetical protein